MAHSPPPTVTLHVHGGISLVHTGLLLAGFGELAKRRAILLRTGRAISTGPNILTASFKSAGVPLRRLVFDVYDRSDEFHATALDACDVYFKRSWSRTDVAALPRALAAKVQPLGLNFLCRTWWSTRWVLQHIVPRVVAKVLRGDRNARRHHAHEAKDFFTSPELGFFECPPDHPVRERIAFQTRVWTREELGPESEQLNEDRVATVRALRREFGSRFEGGLVPTALARARWPAEVSSAPSRRRAHIAWLQQSLIAVGTRGLHHSTPFKIPEYLASSKCIVAEPLRNALPVPLVPGKHLLTFESPQGCVEQCVRLLEDRHLRDQLRCEAFRYWCDHGRPERVVATALDAVGELSQEHRPQARLG
jgi:hypothetical protein